MTPKTFESIDLQGRRFDLALFRKRRLFGAVEVDHWWMPVTKLYRSNPNVGDDNFRSIVDAFWALCRLEGLDRAAGNQQAYLLANLSPWIRTHGSRRIFADAYLDSDRKSDKASWRRDLAELDSSIDAERNQSTSWHQFRRMTKKLLGPPKWKKMQTAIYQGVCGELFDDAVRQLASSSTSQAIETTVAAWRSMMHRIGRRSRNAETKTIYDMLSYESRAAVHQCYSAAWLGCILPHLIEKYNLNDITQTFLCFWHLAPVRLLKSGKPNFLFHGHCFGLHPATGTFASTEAGRTLIGEWLSSPRAKPGATPGGKLLHGMLVAICHYEDRRNRIRVKRRRKEVEADLSSLPDDVETSEES